MKKQRKQHILTDGDINNFIGTLNPVQRTIFLVYRHQLTERLKCPKRQDGWDEAARELAEMEQLKRGEQGIFG